MKCPFDGMAISIGQSCDKLDEALVQKCKSNWPSKDDWFSSFLSNERRFGLLGQATMDLIVVNGMVVCKNVLLCYVSRKK